MKLNPECARDVLPEVEQLELNQTLTFAALHKRLAQYEHDELTYTCLKLEEAGYIQGNINHKAKIVMTITDLTYEGHQFLAIIAPQSFWEKIKNGIKEHGIETMTAFLAFARDSGFEQLKAMFEKHI